MVDLGGGKRDLAGTLRHSAFRKPLRPEGKDNLPKQRFARQNGGFSFSPLPPWAVNPTVYPLYPGASADYSSPPCCVCLHRKNGKRAEIPRPGPISPSTRLRKRRQRHLLAAPQTSANHFKNRYLKMKKIHADF